LLRDQNAKAKQHEMTLVKLQQSADRLERVLAGIMGESVDSEPVQIASIASVRPPDDPSLAVIPRPSPPPFVGVGLATLKGKLDFPVDGTLVQRFGKQRHEEFADMLFKKGIEVLASEGAEVRAVAPGRVLFTQVLPGYGQVVILDHGKRYYTLYGRLRKANCQVGQIVGAGEVLAMLGKPDHKGRNFYFELRIRGKATNPAVYFAESSATKRG